MSHPMWVRGLKPMRTAYQSSIPKSHPMWVRGLKLQVPWMRIYKCVAPHVGAWIETCET